MTIKDLLYLQRRILSLEERVAMLETKQNILLEGMVEMKKGSKE